MPSHSLWVVLRHNLCAMAVGVSASVCVCVGRCCIAKYRVQYIYILLLNCDVICHKERPGHSFQPKHTAIFEDNSLPLSPTSHW